MAEPGEIAAVDFPCWCDGDVTCHGRSTAEFGLCPSCERAGHGALPPLPFSLVEPTDSGSVVGGGDG